MKKFAFTFLAFILANLCFSQTVPPSKSVPVAEHYEGGKEAMYKFINDNIVYPAAAKRNRIQGECVIAFVLNEDGTTTGHRIVSEKAGGTGAEALRVVKLLKFRKPGYKMQTSVPVIFKL